MSSTTPDHHRHAISDHAWETIAPHPSGGPGKVGRPAEDNRNRVFRSLRTGAPWRDLPPDYGQWNTTAHRFGRWQKTDSRPSFWLPCPMLQPGVADD